MSADAHGDTDGPASPREGRWGRLAGHRAAPVLLFLFAVVEGCLVPAPTEALYAALALGRPRGAWALAAVAAAGSVLGGVIAWMAGAWFAAGPGEALLRSPRVADASAPLAAAYQRNAAWALATSGYTPIPYVAYGIVAGVVGVPLGTFVAFSAVGRGLKYALLAGIARVAAPLARRWMDRSTVAVLVVVAVIAVLAAIAVLR